MLASFDYVWYSDHKYDKIAKNTFYFFCPELLFMCKIWVLHILCKLI
jgi:hypothetical protein